MIFSSDKAHALTAPAGKNKRASRMRLLDLGLIAVAVGIGIPLIGPGDDQSSDDFRQHHAVIDRRSFAETFDVKSTVACHD